jgi:hypothetical protein
MNFRSGGVIQGFRLHPTIFPVDIPHPGGMQVTTG